MKNSNRNSTSIKIGLIDTGVDATHPDLKNAVITQYSYKNMTFMQDVIPTDEFGHGTACASIIHRIVPCAEIVSIQCLNCNAQAEGETILSAIDWCINQNIDIINLSLGALSYKYKDKFIILGQKAIAANILIFASCHDSGYPAIPSCLTEYQSVLGKSVRGKYVYHYQNGTFIAHGGKQRIAWTSPRYILSEGSSFATARMSAFAAKIKKNSQLTKYNDLVNAIISCATEKPINLPSIARCRAAEYNSEFFKIHNAGVVSFTKEMHPLILFSDLTGFNISNITDLPFKNNSIKNMDILSSKCDISIDPFSHLDDNLSSSKIDTVIISRTSMHEAITNNDYLLSILERSIHYNKNIYCLEYIDIDSYPEIYNEAKCKNCNIRHPMLSYDDLFLSSHYRNMYGHIGTDTPILGIFGTGTAQGKFSVQLMLRRLLKHRGFNVNNYGTETHSELFGFEGYYPLEIDASVKFSQLEMISFIQGDIRRIEITNRPDILIVGGQSGTIPHSYSIKSSEYTLPTLAFMMATIPHAYLLCVNIFDELNYIEDTLRVIEGLGKGQVTAIICSRYTRKIDTNSSQVINYKVSEKEYESFKKIIQESFGLSVFDIFNSQDASELCDLIISFFS